MKVGIAGAGGIGSNVAACLVRSGVKALKIIDFDRVEKSNLNRQFYFHDQIGQYKVDALADNLNRIAPDLQIDKVVLKLDGNNMQEVFDGCDAVVEGFDGKVEKKMLLETLAPTGRIIVSASGVAGSALNTIEVRRMGTCTVIGDFCTDAAGAPCYAPKVSAVAAMLADVILAKGGYYGR